MKDAKGNPVEGNDIVIAVIDTGVDYTHPDLGGCLGPSCKVIEVTILAMTIATHGPYGTRNVSSRYNCADGRLKGTAPKARLLAYKVLPTFTTTTATSDLLLALKTFTQPSIKQLKMVQT